MSSYTAVSAEKVSQAAEKIINEILFRRALENAELMLKIMAKGKRIAWYSLKTRKFSYQEAYEIIQGYCKDSYNFEFFRHWSCYAWDDLDRAKQLKILASVGDPINISASDAQLLWR